MLCGVLFNKTQSKFGSQSEGVHKMHGQNGLETQLLKSL